MAAAMWRVNVFVIMTVMICRYATGQVDENFIFEQDIWNDEVATLIENDPTNLFRKLCERYNLKVNEQPIDCDKIRAGEETLNEEEHLIEKREAPEDELLEGSGEEPPVPPAEQEKEALNPATPDEKPADVEPSKEVEDEKKAPEPAESESPPEEPKSETAPEVLPKEDAEKSEDATEKSEDKEAQATTEAAQAAEAHEEPAVEAEATDLGVEPLPETSNPPEGEKTPEETKEVDAKPNASEPPAIVAEGGKVEVAETADKEEKSEAKQEGRKLTQEELNNQQSGNAVVPAGGDIFETEQKVEKMQHNESIKSAVAEEPKSGESSETTGRKDNSLLIGLFVAVLAVGAAAFAYNFIKKRKNRNAARTEQNGTTVTADPEEGREMKPLMKTTAEPTNSVDYKDEK